MGGNGIAGQAGLSSWITHRRRKQRNGRAAGASTSGRSSAAATRSRAACFHSQKPGGPLARRRPLAIGRRIEASRAARMTIATKVIARGDGPEATSANDPTDISLGKRTTCGSQCACRMDGVLLHRTSSGSSNFRNCFDAQQKVIVPSCRRCALSYAMTIHRLLRNTTFGPEEIERLVTAYEETLRALGLNDRSDPITQLVAEKIIAVGRLGIEDPAEISKVALKELGS